MNIAIIPARGGSKRIPEKNIIDFCGKPMISYALEAASDSGLFDKIHVSTESAKIASVVNELGYDIDFGRPEELADDHSGLMPVLQHCLREYDDRGERYENVMLLMPCCPLLEVEDIKKGHDVFMSFAGKNPLHVVTPYPVPIEWAYRRQENGLLTPESPGAYAIRSQDMEPAYYECGPFSWFHRSHLLSDTPTTDEGFCSIVLPKSRAIDIDEPEDLLLAETLYRGRNKPGNKEKQ